VNYTAAASARGIVQMSEGRRTALTYMCICDMRTEGDDGRALEEVVRHPPHRSGAARRKSPDALTYTRNLSLWCGAQRHGLELTTECYLRPEHGSAVAIFDPAGRRLWDPIKKSVGGTGTVDAER